MAKFMFLICILVALVRENVSKPSPAAGGFRSKLVDCIANKATLPFVSNYPTPQSREGVSRMICWLERFAIINENKTVNTDNLNTFASKAFHEEDGPYKPRVEALQTCADAAVANVNDTIVNVHIAVVKCLIETKIRLQISISEKDIP